ncbi:MAG: ketoacyl-ACP synthase III [Ignavibacteria bacterium]|jgi:3-oxoacyl-[acyl-carrier-protein] synthase-3|nr:ketoacyl-ACP synthase III [Ignavibacteria bacterium]
MNNKGPFNAYISSVGHYFPERIVDNNFFADYLDTSDDWITTRTGISERRYLEKDQPTSYAAVNAARMILDKRGISADEIDLLIVTTVTPDMFYPSTACRVADRIGAKNCWGYDISAACSGFIFGITTGASFIENGVHKKVLVIGADKMSSIINMDDRNTCVLFGDGAAGVLLEPTEDKSMGVLDHILRIDGRGEKFLYQPGGGSLNPPTHETIDNKMHYVHQEGKNVFKEAVKGMADVSVEIMERNSLNAEDVAFLVPHQANLRIIQATAERIGVGMEKVMLNINKYGNTTSATIPSCISEYFHEGKLKKGDNIILASFGAGFTWGSVLVKWAI